MITSLFFGAIFLGFAWYSILFVINRKFIKSQTTVLNDTVDNSAIHLVRYIGILFFTYFTFSVANSVINSEHGNYVIINRMFGPYWFGFWIYPFGYFVLSQLLWVRRIKTNMPIRFLIAIFLLFTLSIEKLVIIITSLHTDYLGSSWTFSNEEFIGNIVLDWVVKLFIFAVLISLTNFLLNKRKYLINR